MGSESSTNNMKIDNDRADWNALKKIYGMTAVDGIHIFWLILINNPA